MSLLDYRNVMYYEIDQPILGLIAKPDFHVPIGIANGRLDL